MIYISKFKKDIWPLYVPPLPDELFSSWIYRMISNHKVNSDTFAKNYLQQKLFERNNDIDDFPKDEIIKIITKHTPYKTKELNQLFLSSYNYTIIENNTAEEISKSIQFLKTKSFNNRRNSIVYCPSCLSKNTPYFKKKWRLTTSIVCIECNSYLLDYCPGCNSQISYWNNKKSGEITSHISHSIAICKCGYDLSNFISPFSPTLTEIEYQKYINSTIENGYNLHTQYSFTYLNTLLYIAYMLKKMTKSPRFKKKFNKMYPELDINIDVPLHDWNVIQRRQLLPIAYNLLQNFPKNIKNIFPKKYTVRKEFKQLPYWFEKELHFR